MEKILWIGGVWHALHAVKQTCCKARVQKLRFKNKLYFQQPPDFNPIEDLKKVDYKELLKQNSSILSINRLFISLFLFHLFIFLVFGSAQVLFWM